MIRLPESLNAWQSPAFNGVLKRELEELGAAKLPLQHALSSSSIACDDKLNVMIISVADEPGVIRAKVGAFFSGIVAGCSCADDPTPVEAQNEYCELLLTIDKVTAATTVSLPIDQT